MIILFSGCIILRFLIIKYLDKHYENLLLCEPRFFKLSKQSFPTLKNPFFRSNSRGNPGSAFDYNHRGQDFNLRMQFNFPNFLSHVGQTQHIQPYGHIGNLMDIMTRSNRMDIEACVFHLQTAAMSLRIK
ncbi:hypothetical protein NC653_012676 [Populus alba x Populus x berolinensis]|uniref:Uncharacterized protein n=1 Tax=Populus alba x Populus x berolinensis TaxID=444605 RepID=A0AAD6QSI0_9ROSI|nr:hypothetical protein NC653_012676 [Populus alba x Populus x berolinensis]